MPWVLLIVAGLFEVAWAVGLKYTEGFTRLVPSILTIAGIVASMYLLGRAARDIPIGTAYAAWTGIGAAGTAAIGMLFLGEPTTPWRVAFLTLLVTSVIGLQVTTPAD